MALSRSPSRRFSLLRKSASFNSYELQLSVKELDNVLDRILRTYASTGLSAENASAVLNTITEELKTNGRVKNMTLFDVINVLDSFMLVASNVPNKALFEVHSLLGLMRQTLGDHELANQSYMKAL